MRITDAYLVHNYTTLPDGTIQAERTETIPFIEWPPNTVPNYTLSLIIEYEQDDGESAPVILCRLTDANDRQYGTTTIKPNGEPLAENRYRAPGLFFATLAQRGTYTIHLRFQNVATPDGGIAATHRFDFEVR